MLALTTNPEGRQVQHARTAAGRLVAQEIVDAAAAANAGKAYGNVGLVVGATIGRTGVDSAQVQRLDPGARASAPRAPVPPTWPRCSATRCHYVLPSTSREVMGAGPDPVQTRVRAERMLAQMRTSLPVG